jgi:acetylornithine aminotransferase
MVGIEFDRPCLEMRLIGLANRVLFSVTSESVIRLLPPLIIQKEEISELVSRLVSTINTFADASGDVHVTLT